MCHLLTIEQCSDKTRFYMWQTLFQCWGWNYFSNITCASQVYFSFLTWLQLARTKFNHLGHGVTKKCKLKLTLFSRNFSQHGHFIPLGLVLTPWQSRLHLQKPRKKMGLERRCGLRRRCRPRVKKGIWVSPKKGWALGHDLTPRKRWSWQEHYHSPRIISLCVSREVKGCECCQ